MCFWHSYFVISSLAARTINQQQILRREALLFLDKLFIKRGTIKHTFKIFYIETVIWFTIIAMTWEAFQSPCEFPIYRHQALGGVGEGLENFLYVCSICYAFSDSGMTWIVTLAAKQVGNLSSAQTAPPLGRDKDTQNLLHFQYWQVKQDYSGSLCSSQFLTIMIGPNFHFAGNKSMQFSNEETPGSKRFKEYARSKAKGKGKLDQETTWLRLAIGHDGRHIPERPSASTGRRKCQTPGSLKPCNIHLPTPPCCSG